MLKIPVDVERASPMNDILNIDDSAVEKIRTAIKEENKPSFFRVFVTGGGCSGFQYGFDFSDTFEDDDFVLDFEDFKILVDPISYQYIVGSTLFYERRLMGEFFTVNNPNAKNTCGCGSSFEI